MFCTCYFSLFDECSNGIYVKQNANFYLAFVFLQLQPLPLKSRTGDLRDFDSSAVSPPQQQQNPDRPWVFLWSQQYIGMATDTLSEMIQVKSTDMLPIRITSHLRLLIFRVSVHGGVIFFHQVSITYHLPILWGRVFSVFLLYLCAISGLKTREPQVFFVHCLLTSSAVAYIPGSIKSNSVVLNSVFFFHSFQYLIQVVEHNWDM